MYIKRLHLTNYRNHTDAEFTFAPVTTFIVGDNAVGKTNILEAIALLTNAKPLRGRYDHEIILNGNGYARVEGEVVRRGNEELAEQGQVLDVFIERKDPSVNTTSKKVRVNKVAKTRTCVCRERAGDPLPP